MCHVCYGLIISPVHGVVMWHCIYKYSLNLNTTNNQWLSDWLSELAVVYEWGGVECESFNEWVTEWVSSSGWLINWVNEQGWVTEFVSENEWVNK